MLDNLLYILPLMIVVIGLGFVWRKWRQEQQLSQHLRELLTKQQLENGRLLASVEQHDDRLLLEERRREYTELECSRLRQSLSESEQTRAELRARLEILEQMLTTLREEKANLSVELQDRFRLLASEILQERSLSLEERSQELLRPLREDLQRFASKMETTYGQESRERFSLQEQIKELIERSLQLGKEADQLSRALRGETKVQGNWGEMILEKILEGSGLIAGQEYEVQECHTDEDNNRFIPDVIIKYPDGGRIIIDSKVSLTAYTHYANAESEEERNRYATLHLQSIQNHINELSAKDYRSIVKDSAGFVMMFIPNEPAYSLALQLRPTLWDEAYRRHIILMNGTNLIAALRMALDIWQRSRQISNVEGILGEVSKLYDKFRVFSEKFLDAEEKLKRAHETLLSAQTTLHSGRGNIVSSLEKIRRMGIKVKKNLPETLTQDLDSLEEDTDQDSL